MRYRRAQSNTVIMRPAAENSYHLKPLARAIADCALKDRPPSACEALSAHCPAVPTPTKRTDEMASQDKITALGFVSMLMDSYAASPRPIVGVAVAAVFTLARFSEAFSSWRPSRSAYRWRAVGFGAGVHEPGGGGISGRLSSPSANKKDRRIDRRSFCCQFGIDALQLCFSRLTVPTTTGRFHLRYWLAGVINLSINLTLHMS